MARVVPIVLPLALMAAPVWGQSAAGNESVPPPERWRIAEGRPSSDFSLSTGLIAPPTARSQGSRIIGGTEIAPNATIGFGLFGRKPERSGMAPVTIFDVNSRQSRKAAVGLSIRF